MLVSTVAAIVSVLDICGAIVSLCASICVVAMLSYRDVKAAGIDAVKSFSRSSSLEEIFK